MLFPCSLCLATIVLACAFIFVVYAQHNEAFAGANDNVLLGQLTSSGRPILLSGLAPEREPCIVNRVIMPPLYEPATGSIRELSTNPMCTVDASYPGVKDMCAPDTASVLYDAKVVKDLSIVPSLRGKIYCSVEFKPDARQQDLQDYSKRNDPEYNARLAQDIAKSLQAEKSTLQSQLKGLQDSNTQCSTEKAMLASVRDGLQSQRDTLTLERDTLKTAKDNLTLQLQQLAADKQRVDGDRSTSISKLQADNGKLQADNSKFQTDNGKLQADLGTLQTNYNNMKDELAAAKAKAQADVAAANSQCSALISSAVSTQVSKSSSECTNLLNSAETNCQARVQAAIASAPSAGGWSIGNCPGINWTAVYYKLPRPQSIRRVTFNGFPSSKTITRWQNQNGTTYTVSPGQSLAFCVVCSNRLGGMGGAMMNITPSNSSRTYQSYLDGRVFEHGTWFNNSEGNIVSHILLLMYKDASWSEVLMNLGDSTKITTALTMDDLNNVSLQYS
jgi:hypothetical protein